MKFRILLFIGIVSFALSCKKTETQTITGNQPAIDSTIDNVLRDNFIHKAYLAVIGRTPTDLEKIGARTVIDKNGCTAQSREDLLNILFAAPDYKENVFNIDNAGLLSSYSGDVINYYIIYYTNLVKDTTNPNYYMYLHEIERLYLLKATARNFFNDSIDLVEVHKRMTYNILYENLNGGIYNWTSTVFPYFIKRKPTQAEMSNSYLFIAGMEGKMFLKTGHSTDDMVNIFYTSDEYYEGQVRILFLRHLFREPTFSELQQLSTDYKKDHNYIKLQKAIFLSNDFLGKK